MRLPKSYYNNLSLAGTILAGIALLLIFFSVVLTFVFDAGSSYLGLFSYILLPGVMLLGLLLIPIGMLRTIRRAKRQNTPMPGKWLVIDFNDPRYRNAASVFIIGTVVLILLSAVGSYEAYHYTESVEFCGTVCHEVMKPEHVTYLNSSHARVACVECHVGQGANWYVKSKLSGLYQVYAVVADNFPRPIPTPITSLRPAKETCEECHWPQKFYTSRLRFEKHYLSDSANTEWDIHLRMKTNSTHGASNLMEGIHWHINPNIKIEYIASDAQRESIPWVRMINVAQGDTTVYEDSWMPLEPEEITAATPRVMDCMDCHNRPSHNYRLPSEFIDYAITSGAIPNIPEVKHLAMEVLKDPYPTTDTALMVIKNTFAEFYSDKYPAVPSSLVDQAISRVMTGFENNIFPEMGASWDVYPDHIGHVEFNGCFRCHNDTHESSSGMKITKDCNACHTILMQGTPDHSQSAPLHEGLDFQHPVDIQEAWKESLCTDCHRYLYL